MMYGGYNRASVLAEPAVSFFALLNAGYRAQYRRQLSEANIALLHLASRDERRRFIQHLITKGFEPDAIIERDDSKSIDILRKELSL